MPKPKEPFPARAKKLWDGIPLKVRGKILDNVWCARCRNVVRIENFTLSNAKQDLLLSGYCTVCDKEVARLIENPNAG